MNNLSTTAHATNSNASTTAASPSISLMSEQFVNNVREMLRSLQAIRNEHVNALQSLQSQSAADLDVDDGNNQQPQRSRMLRAEKENLLREQVSDLEKSILDSELMLSVSYNMQGMGADYCKLQTQIRRLNQENEWLREELTSTEHRLKSSESSVVELQTAVEQLKFEASLNNNKDGVDSARDGTGAAAADAAGGGGDMNNSTLMSKSMSRHTLDFPDDDAANQVSAMGGIGASSSSGMEIPARLRTLHNLVIQYASQGRFEVAVPLCKQTLEDLQRSIGHDHPDVATMLNILALVYRDQNKYKDAARLLNEALEIREKTLGPDHPAVAATLNNLAVLYGKRGKFKDAEPLCRRALEIREKVYGHDHVDVAKQLSNLALLVQNQGKFAEVEEYYKRAQRIYEAHFGADDTNVEKTKNGLAAAYNKQGRLRDAEALYKDILTLAHQRDFGVENTPNVRGSAVRPLWKLAEQFQAKETESLEADEVVRRFLHLLNDRTNNSSRPIMNGGGGASASHNNANVVVKHRTPTILSAVKNLAMLYRKTGRADAALLLDKFLDVMRLQQHNDGGGTNNGDGGM